MKRIFYIVILLVFTPALVHAFGLGKLDLNSALNEPFDARIQLLSPTADELDSLKVNLADSEAFARAKVDRPFILSKLRFELRRSVDDGPDYIRVYSQDPIREPFLNFLVEVSWSNGRLFREYTVLLDPPLYDPNAKSGGFSQLAESSAPTEVVSIEDPDHKVVTAADFEKFSGGAVKSTSSSVTTPSYTPNVNYTGGDYGPTTGADTLWSIASDMRPDTSVSVNKMMMALLRANPDAFIDQNINGLKRGQILRMPNESEMNALSNAEALTEVQSQYSAWGDIRENLSSQVSERPEVSSTPETTTIADDEVATEEDVADAELKLVSADEEGEATDQVSSTDSGTGEELVLAQETIQVLTQENIELKDRVLESEALLDDLKRLLSLKDDELAALQAQMAAAETEAEMEVVEDEATEAEETMEVVEDEATEAEETMEVVEDEATEAEETMEVVEDEATEAEETMEVVEDEATEVEETMEVVETPEPTSSGIMGMVDQYLAPVKDMLPANPMIILAVAGLIVVLIIIAIVLKFRKEPAETVDINAMTEEAFPDFDSGDLGDVGEDVDSEAVTVLPDSEAETVLPDESEADFDLDLDEDDNDKTQIVSMEETAELPEEPEEEEDPLQEVNTYLAFEQFDQAEEFVRNVINDDPDNPEYHSKLLEVFYTSGNKKSYEEAAKVLHEKVGGEGEYWNMATAMWQEMSPNRALFEAGADDDDDEDDDADNTGGFVNVTADDEASSDDAGDLDFDIGGTGAEEATPAAEESSDSGEEMLDITASADEEMLDVTGSSAGEDLLDVTAAVSMEDALDSEAETAKPTPADEVLDISGTGGNDLLDLTGGEESASEDLLDVTAATNLDLDSEEDLLDVTAATSAGADSSELLDLDEGLELDIENATAADSDSNEIEFDVPMEAEEPAESETVEFDMEPEAEEQVESADDENALEFDVSIDESSELELDVSEPETADDAGLEIDLGEAEADEEPIRLDVDESSDDMSLEVADSADEMSLEFDTDTNESDGGDIELDLSIEEDEPVSAPEETTSDAPEIDFDFSLDDDTPEELSADADFDLDGTVEIPKNALSSAEADDDDDDEDHTVFVPRAAQPEEQSAEDEIATKLDLAKAYVELGDKDSAKTILDEVMAEGNDEQRKQAEDLLGQV
jgi:pilus assembly protein FimV